MKQTVEIHFNIKDKLKKEKKLKGSVIYKLDITVPVDTFPYIMNQIVDVCKKYNKHEPKK